MGWALFFAISAGLNVAISSYGMATACGFFCVIRVGEMIVEAIREERKP